MDTKDMGNIYYNLYTDCVKFKKQKESQQGSTKSINCDEYRDKYKLFENTNKTKNCN